MLRLSKKAINEFKEIYHNEFDVLLTDDEANKLGIELLDLFRIIYRPIPKNDNSLTNEQGSIALGNKK